MFFFRENKKYIFLILLAAVVAEGGYLIFHQTFSAWAVRDEKREIFQGYARHIVTECASAGYKPSCYEEEVPKLMAVLTMGETFEVTRLLQGMDPEYQYCHVLAHKISERETEKDPNHWTDVMTQCPSGLCSNGCLHGGFLARFRKERLSPEEIEKLKPVLKTVCEPRDRWSPTGLERSSCYHALGHLIMYITNGEIRRANVVCRDIVDTEHVDLCLDGNFMQIFQQLEPEDHALVEKIEPKTKEEARDFCSSFSGSEKTSCRNESWPLFVDQIEQPDGLETFCAYLEDSAGRDRCFMSMAYVLTARWNLDPGRIIPFCSKLSPGRSANCFAHAASRMIETDYRNIDSAASLCTQVNKLGDATACYEELLFYASYNFHPGSEEFYRICNALPADWSQKCLAGKMQQQ